VFDVEKGTDGGGRRSVAGRLAIEHRMTAHSWWIVAAFARSGLEVDSMSGESVAGTVDSHRR
jgi:hypothetical protein